MQNRRFCFFLQNLLPGENRNPINGLIWMGSKEFMLQQVEEKLTDGFTCLKLKIGAIDFKSELDILQFNQKTLSRRTT